MEMRGVIFDLDGVLCHTDHYHYLAWKALADRLGLPFDERVNDRLRGVSRMDSLEIVLSLGEKQFTQAEKEQMAEEKKPALPQLPGKNGAGGSGSWGRGCAARFEGARLEARCGLLQQKRTSYSGTDRPGGILRHCGGWKPDYTFQA